MSMKTLTWKWNKVRKCQEIQRCHNINVVALTPTCLSMWKTCPTSYPRSRFPTLIPSTSSQSHQTSLLGAVSRQVPALLSSRVDLGDVQEVSWQPGECQWVWFYYGEADEGRRQVRHHHWGLGSTSGCLQLVRQAEVSVKLKTKDISFLYC